MSGPIALTKHFQVSKILAERIKYMVPGEPLPTVIVLMREFDASQATISSALRRLRSQGLIERPMGKKRLVVANVSARTLFRLSFIRSLWATPDHDAVFNAIYEEGHNEHWGFDVHNFSDVASLNLEHAVGDNDGAIILGLGTNPPAHLVKALQSSRKPLVFLRERPEGIQSSLVWVDDREVGNMATNHLLGLGHRRILIMLSEPPNASSSLRLLGWRDALQAAGEKNFEELIVDCSVKPGNDAIGGSYERLMMWFKEPTPEFTAMFCTSWTGALAAMRAFRETGRSIPDDVSLITYGSEAAFSAFLNPPLTTVRTDVKVHAREAIRLMRAALTNVQAKGETLLLKPTMAVRGSTRRVAS